MARPERSITRSGGGPLPIASGLPVVVTLLDLAPWELPDAFERTVASRFGQRLRAQILREAAAVIVGSEATARAARRLLRVRRDRLRVIRLAPRAAFATARTTDRVTAGGVLRERLGLPDRYLVCPAGSTRGSISPRRSMRSPRWPRWRRRLGARKRIELAATSAPGRRESR